MWVKKTAEELKQEELSEAKRKFPLFYVLIGSLVITAIMAGLGFLGSRFVESPAPLYTIEELPLYLPFFFIFGFILCSCIALSKQKARKTVICPKCEKSKFADDNNQCDCGGQFEHISILKWVDNK